MTWQSVLLVVLAGVDVAALAVGLTVLAKVRTIVVDAGEEINAAVQTSIGAAKDDAVRQFSDALGPALAVLAGQVPVVLRQALGNIRVAAGGHLVVDHPEAPGHEYPV